MCDSRTQHTITRSWSSSCRSPAGDGSSHESRRDSLLAVHGVSYPATQHRNLVQSLTKPSSLRFSTGTGTNTKDR